MPGRFVPRARIRAKEVRVENDGTFLANLPEKETDQRNNKAGKEEIGATSICEDIILVHTCKLLLLDGLFERQVIRTRGESRGAQSRCFAGGTKSAQHKIEQRERRVPAGCRRYKIGAAQIEQAGASADRMAPAVSTPFECRRRFRIPYCYGLPIGVVSVASVVIP
jgi:hypothetical protein